jgi:hypothetical protein
MERGVGSGGAANDIRDCGLMRSDAYLHFRNRARRVLEQLHLKRNDCIRPSKPNDESQMQTNAQQLTRTPRKLKPLPRAVPTPTP